MADVIDRDLGWKRIMREIQNARHVDVVIGIQEGATHLGKTIAEYAMYNEYGTSRIPERSFMRSTFDEEVDALSLLIRSQYDAVVTGGSTLRQALGRIGLKHQSDIQEKIRDLKIPPNAESTIKKKGSDNPLIDTGAMIGSVRYVIRTK